MCLWDLPDAVMGGLNISALHAVTPYCVLVIKNIHNSWASKFCRVTQAVLVIFPVKD